jgi:hypothetical protein
MHGPPAGQAILHDIGYLMHEGGHGTIPSDWPVFLKFMQMHFQGGGKREGARPTRQSSFAGLFEDGLASSLR